MVGCGVRNPVGVGDRTIMVLSRVAHDLRSALVVRTLRLVTNSLWDFQKGVPPFHLNSQMFS